MEKDTNVVADVPDYKPEARECIFSKGQSKRLWNELYKVVDSSDVIIQVSMSSGSSYTSLMPAL